MKNSPLAEASRYAGKILKLETLTQKFLLDFDQLKYAFRSLDKFAPWLNHIWLVTNGQKPPNWLNHNNRIGLILLL